jgi:putative phage-type endonuclease
MIQQRTDEWLKARLGKLTGSIAFDAIAVLKSGKGESQARANVRLRLLAEMLTGSSSPYFESNAMKWGTQCEGDARVAYEKETGQTVEEAPFYDCPSMPMCGASPDGLVGNHGLIEIKCPETTTFIGYVIANEVPEKYKPQMAMQLLATGRKWVDFVAFDPRVKFGTKIFIKRYYPSIAELNDYKEKFMDFRKTVDETYELFLSKSKVDEIPF